MALLWVALYPQGIQSIHFHDLLNLHSRTPLVSRDNTMLFPVKMGCSSYLLLYLVHLVEDSFVQVGKLYSIIRDDDGTPQKCSMETVLP